MPNKIFITLKKRRDFLTCQNNGKKIVSNSFVIYLFKNKFFDYKDINFRLGIIASKKTGNAVKRNKAKRIIRSLVYNVLTKYGESFIDYVIVARGYILKTKYEQLSFELIKALRNENKI